MGRFYCVNCEQNTSYTVREELIKEFKGYQVNVIERIARCDACKKDIYVPEIESGNFKRLYDKYEELVNSK